MSMLRPKNSGHPAASAVLPPLDKGINAVKVIASSIRKGNIVEIESKLYVILTAENIHPGKGTPVTQVDMRRHERRREIVPALQDDGQVERAWSKTASSSSSTRTATASIS